MAVENNQSGQQESSQLSGAKLELPPSQDSVNPIESYSLLKIIERRPWLFLGGASTCFLTIATVAMFSLMNTGHVEQAKPKPAPVVDEKPAATWFQTDSSIPAWLFGAVALSCAVGCLVIAKQLKRPAPPPRQLRKYVKYSPTEASPRRQQRKRRHVARPPVSPTPQRTFSAITPLSTKAPTKTPTKTFTKTEPTITVLAPEENLPLDSGQESLAEMLDLRRHHSLSSILRNS